MANSNRFRALETRLEQLRVHFLPQEYSPELNYTHQQVDHARAYKLLAHAEIEHFIEEIVKDLIKRKVSNWQKTKEPSAVLTSLLICCNSSIYTDSEDAPEDTVLRLNEISKSSQKNANTAEEILQSILTQFLKIIEKNHGVRHKNLRKLVVPIGVRLSELDASWLTALDEFGKGRGEIAHNSIGVQKAINPEDEHKIIQRLIPGLKQLDRLVLRLRA